MSIESWNYKEILKNQSIKNWKHPYEEQKWEREKHTYTNKEVWWYIWCYWNIGNGMHMAALSVMSEGHMGEKERVVTCDELGRQQGISQLLNPFLFLDILSPLGNCFLIIDNCTLDRNPSPFASSSLSFPIHQTLHLLLLNSL